ncbi:hypothetical protein BRADI_3g50435v3 [Brachypodium distachyon]|uniref:Uncharacterized protein n=1 Tax=Brachypodium distachyon TaxID=15368 RepID=A0A2K2D4F4_BRADI|nr:hypothetical protein BRADI_3g50435v3 [Brachypodium distachyon]
MAKVVLVAPLRAPCCQFSLQEPISRHSPFQQIAVIQGSTLGGTQNLIFLPISVYVMLPLTFNILNLFYLMQHNLCSSVLNFLMHFVILIKCNPGIARDRPC